MTTKMLPIAHWPRDDNGELVITSTGESQILAHVITGDHVTIGRVKRWRREALKKIEFMKVNPPVDYQEMMNIATRAQLLRECIEEVGRLNGE
jgi:hypothetical protein